MIIFFPLIFLVYLLVIAIDVLTFFSIIRLLCHKWTVPSLEAFDTTGTPLVDWFVSHVEGVLSRISHRSFSQRTQLDIGIVVLILTRIFLTVLLCN